MRYILCDEGYVEEVLFGVEGTTIECNGKTCISYTGSIPDGYESLVEWANNANVRAYKVINGELVYDEQRDAELQAQYELDASNNAHATIGYVNDKFSKSSTIYDDNMTKTTTDLVIKDAGNYEIPEIIIEGKGDIKTSSGIIEDARAVKVESIGIEGKSVQDGTPTPDAPIEIKNIEGKEVKDLKGRWLEVKSTGENMFDRFAQQGYLEMSKDNVAASTDWQTSDYIKVKPNTTYVISSPNTAITRVLRNEYNSSKVYNATLNRVETTNGGSFTTSSTTKYIRFSVNSGTETRIQLEEKILTEYEQYKENTALIDMNIYDEEDNIIGYREFAEGDVFENGKYTQTKSKIILNGSESNWNKSGAKGFYNDAFLSLVNIDVSKPSISSHYKYSSTTWESNGKFGITTSGTLWITLSDTMNDMTLAEFKTWLSENKVEIEYTLKTPIEHTLDYEVLELHEGYNRITLNDELEPKVDISYIAQKTTFKDRLMLQVSNDNLLVNKVLNHSINGLDVSINEDKSINIVGTATEYTEIILNGFIENIEPVFMLNDKNVFVLSGLINNINLNLYNYDGNDKTLLFSGSNGEINIEGTQYITCSTLSIASGEKIEATVLPMITANNEEYVEGKLNNILNTNVIELNYNEHLKIDRSYISLVDGEKETKLKVINSLNSFDPTTLIQTNQERIDIITKYFPSDYIYERLAKLEVGQKEIRSEVSKKVGEEEVASVISQTAEEIFIKSNNFGWESENSSMSTDGKIITRAGKIGGFEISNNNLYMEIKPKAEYTEEVVTKIQKHILNQQLLTAEEIELYDANDDGKIDAYDLLFARKMVDANITPDKPGKFIIKLNEQAPMQSSMGFQDGDGNYRTKIDAFSVEENGVSISDVNEKFENLNLNMKTEVGINESGYFYIRGIVSEDLQYQLNCLPTNELRFQKYENGAWSNIWTK